MSRLLKILFVLSILINVTFIFYEIKHPPIPARYEIAPAFRIKNLKVKDEKLKFFKKLKTLDPLSYRKKYVFINIWDTHYNGSAPVLPVLDTLIEPLRKDFSYVLLNEENDNISNYTLQKKKVHTKNFIYMNDADSMMHAFFQEFRMKSKFKFLFALPITVIMNHEGKVVYLDTTSRMSPYREDSIGSRKAFKELKEVLVNLK